MSVLSYVLNWNQQDSSHNYNIIKRKEWNDGTDWISGARIGGPSSALDWTEDGRRQWLATWILTICFTTKYHIKQIVKIKGHKPSTLVLICGRIFSVIVTESLHSFLDESLRMMNREKYEVLQVSKIQTCRLEIIIITIIYYEGTFFHRSRVGGEWSEV